MINSITERPFVPLSYDLVFKRVFADEYDKRPLKTLLNVILNINISINDITILNSEMVGKNINVKKNTVDLIVKLKDGTRVGIEMNRACSDKLVFRNTLYMFRFMGNALNKGARYEDIDEYIQINFDMDGEHSEPIDIYTLCNEKYPDKKLTNKLQIYRINVPYFTKRCYNLREEELAYKDRFIGMIGASTLKELNKIAGRDDIMEEMSKKVEECNNDEDVLYQYNYGEYLADLAILEGTEKGMKQGIEKGIKQGLEKGIQQGLEKGMQEGIEKGIQQGIEQGKELGIKQGLKEGQVKGFEEGKNKGYEEGLSLGKQEAIKQQKAKLEKLEEQRKLEVVKRMLEENFDDDIIIKISGITLEELKNIKQ